MADANDPSSPGDGPYRSAPLTPPPRRWRVWLIGGGVAALAALLAWVATRGDDVGGRPGLATVPPGLFDDVEAWPAPEEELPPATPLAPLLVADQPEALAVLSPGEGAMRLRRGEGLSVRFNRPMVDGPAVGREAEGSPLVFEPPLAGTTRWVSRSQLSFAPDPGAWTADVREVQLRFAPELASLSGEALVDDLERVVVLDGAPRVISYRSSGRVNAGAPLPLVFDAPVSAATLGQELLAYEIGGGQRSLPVSLRPARNQPEDAYRLDVVLRRALEPGARVGLALAPRYLPWAGNSPAVMTYDLAPRPHLEGVDCEDGAIHAGQCRYQGSPGQIVDIGPSLRLLSSARLDGADASDFQIRPALPGMSVRLTPHGPPGHRLITIRGEWAPDQVYEVRVRGLRTEDGEPVRPLPPLAVRSSGHPATIRVATGRLSFESDAPARMPFAAIHAEPSDVLYRGVAPGEELRALVSPWPFVRDGGASTPLAPLAPTARANRWGPGEYAWRGDGRESTMAVVAFRPDAATQPGAGHTAFAQATDLGVTVRANREGLIVWVTSIATAAPIAGAAVVVADAQAQELTRMRTDADGVARIPLERDPLVVAHALLVERGDDRAAVMLDPRSALGPSAMGLTPGAAPETAATIATVFADRGAYRPGEGLHAKVLLRRVEGARAAAVRQGSFRVRLVAPSGEPAREQPFEPSRYGTASVDFDLPAAASLGEWGLEVVRADAPDQVLGRAGLRVAQFRQPTFRVDVDRVAGPVHAGDTIGTNARGTYLFGAPVSRGRAAWRLTTEGLASYPERWSRFRFTPVGVGGLRGTVAAGEGALDAQGRLHLDAQVQLGGAARTRVTLEAEITDGAGHTHAGRRSFVAYPAAFEVGLRREDDWIAQGEPLAATAVAIDHEGEALTGQSLEARFVREGWHSWWEWSEASHSYRGGAYQMRRAQRQDIVHTCTIETGAEPASCAYTPTRPGTYLVEVRGRDEAGREAIASRRVYVAGPNEQPDRDPPGAPIEVTPSRRGWTVGETAELAFESPFEEAEALITVEREGTISVERRRVSAGGNVIRVPLTEAMVPNAFVGVTLVKGRTAAPSSEVDLGAPDLRFGVAELRVTPASSGLEVTLELEGNARPGDDVPVTVQVRDHEGRPVRGEVALWAVDEGTLRLTGYDVPDPTAGLYRPRPAAFAWEDLRRQLVSRLAAPPMPEASGDGGDGAERAPALDDRERFDPTPLWAPLLVTDEEGRASATMTLPDRPTEYRVMAVAVDATTRSGRASASVVAEQPLVVRPAFPRFVTAGDHVEATAFLHNATEEPLRVRAVATIGGEARPAQILEIPAGGEARVSEPFVAPTDGPLELRFDARAGDEAVAVRDTIPVTPRGRWVRSQVFGAAEGEHELSIGLPEGTPDGPSVVVTVASHPFVGFGGAIEALEGSTWADSESIAATVLGLAAYAGLGISDPRIDADDAAVRGRREVARLLRLQNVDGGFGRWSALDGTFPLPTALAVHALNQAHARGWVDDEEALRRAREALIPLVNGAAFNDYYGQSGLDRTAFGLRVLRDAGMPQGGRTDALFEQRDRLSPEGLAQLALSLPDGDSRADTLVLEAARAVLADRDDEATDVSQIRWMSPTVSVLAPVLEAASRFEVGRPRTADLAGKLLALRSGRPGYPWPSGVDTAHALHALAAYAELFDWRDDEVARIALDGEDVATSQRTQGGAFFRLPVERLRGAHQLRIQGADDGPVFFAIDGRFAVALGEADELARGRRTAIHRVYETADGRTIEPGASVPLGEMVRVRLFVYTEGSSPGVTGIYDPLPAGFEAVDAAEDTTPRGSLDALLGTGPDDGAVDARAYHAMRSLGSIAHRSFRTHATSLYFDALPGGLQEYTYAIRATTPGEYTIPPTQIEALYDAEFVARSAVSTLSVSAE